MNRKNKIEKFDLWNARLLVIRLNNRSGEHKRYVAEKPASWGACQDYNASRMKALPQAVHFNHREDWRIVAQKLRIILQTRGVDQSSVWYPCEYRLLERINKLAGDALLPACNALWQAKAISETELCATRVRESKYSTHRVPRQTWSESRERSFKYLWSKSSVKKDHQGRLADSWDLAFAASKYSFLVNLPPKDTWFRSVKNKLKRSVLNRHNSNA